jgi:hypothetical protein
MLGLVGYDSQPLRDQVVAPKAVFHFDDIVLRANFVNMYRAE